MNRLVYGSKMKKVDRYTIEKVGIPSMVLMERAAFSVCQYVKENIGRDKKFVCICGTGNNGADGIALARMLTIEGYISDVIIVGYEENATEEWKQQKRIASQCGVTMDNNISYNIDKSALKDMLSSYDIIVDALFGIGLTRDVEGIHKGVCEAINEIKKTVYALDVPSGLCADTGKVLGVAVKADRTFTFGSDKTGLWLYKGREFAGEIVKKDIGFPEKAYNDGLEKGDICFSVRRDEMHGIFERKSHSNKGTYGKVLVVGGSKNVYGAAYFTSAAALRLGTGLVRIITHVNNRNLIYDKLPEAMISTYRTAEEKMVLEEMIRDGVSWADAVVVGPGLSKGEEAYMLLKSAMMVTKENDKPIIIDADGLNIIAEHKELIELYHRKTILTPHMGEAVRLVDMSTTEVAENIINVMGDYGKKHNITVVAKDATTVTFGIESSQDKCHNRICINTTGNPGMATGGTGDVLSGMIAAAVSGGIDVEQLPEYKNSDDKDSAKMYLAASVAVYLHGVAGDMASIELGETSVTASDILDRIGKKFFDEHRC